ncbi:MAG: hypothetical protein JW704_03945 [Anaerolineaceae bacterium]|nr:hypothetical protein [Anaerolineaceae bacterium]
MKIDLEPIHQEYISFVTRAGILTIEEPPDGALRISLSDRFTLSVHEDGGLITLDSEEKPTHLKILQSLSRGIMAK